MVANSFQPPCWLKNSHAQTLWAGLVRRRPTITIHYERVTLPDGDFVDLAFAPDNGGPVVLLLHGLQGSIQSRYACGMLNSLHRAAYHPVLLHFRGCSGAVNKQTRLYHAGETGDPAYIISWLQNRYPGRAIAAVGFSLGGNVLLKLLGEQREQTALKAAAAISVPMRLDICANRIDQGFSKLYQWNLVRSKLKIAMQKNARGQLNGVDIVKTYQARSFWEFDDAFTAPLHGFKDVHEYYAQCSSRQFLKDIRVPTLIIHAQDDPFTSAAVIPTKEEVSEFVELNVSKHGGHVGFTNGKWPWAMKYWAEERVGLFLEQHLS